jgi:DNA polymerase-3 subunit alpha
MMEDANKAREDKNRKNHHLILLAMNQEGWTNIKKLTTKANEKFYYAPRIDYADLESHSNGIICLTACLKGMVPYNIMEENYAEAYRHAKKFKGIFGDRFYMELQDGGIDVQITINEVMRRMAQKLDVKVVGAQDAHYVNREDVEAHEGIWAIKTGDTFDKPVGYGKGKAFRAYYSTREFWLKDAHHMLNEELTTEGGKKRLSTLLQSEVEESAKIADRIGDVEIEKKMHLPKYAFIPDITQVGCAAAESDCTSSHYHPGDVEEGETVDLSSYNYLYELVSVGYEKRYKNSWLNVTKEHQDRFASELGDIKDAGLADYFLMMWDVTSWIRSSDIPLGPGRGSAAGSIVSYCLGITDVDPLEYGLIWERFYNAGRKGSMPDIDIDVGKKHRPKVIQYIKERFGEDRVAQIVTFNLLKTKAALKDTAKLLGSKGMPFEDANVMTRMIPQEHNIPVSIPKAIEKSERIKEYSEEHPILFRIAAKLEGCMKSRGTHAAGVVISDEPFSEGFPLRWNTKEKAHMTEWDMEDLDSMGYLKMDILGLKTMDVLHDIEVAVNAEKKKEEEDESRS